MDKIPLGRTGLTVSPVGLGCGGHSRLGQARGASVEQSEAVVRAALDPGITFIDTAAAYGTEQIVGAAIKGRRDEVVLSTKVQVVTPGSEVLGQDFKSAEQFGADIDQGLEKLGVEMVDILHLHGVMPDQYAPCRDRFLPVLEAARAAGKVRLFGLTERFIYDPGHAMLTQALDDDLFDVVMAGFNLINPSARHRVFRQTREKGVGTLIMFAVRRALSDPAALRDLIGDLVDDGLIAGDALPTDNPLGFLVAEGGARSVIDGAYRFCHHEPGVDVVLTGTGSVAHLKENVTSLARGPLARAALERLEAVFGGIDSVSGN